MQLSQELIGLAQLGAELAFWLLLAINVASMAIIAERCWFFWRRRIDGDSMARHLLNFLRLHDLPRARAVLLRYNAPECTILLAGLGELEHGLPAAQEAMQSAQSRERIRMEVRLGVLKAIAQSAPLLGMLGMLLGVLGSMPEFGTSLVDRHGALNPALSGAVASLATMAGGLCVAIPAAAGSILFHRQVDLVLARSNVLVHLVLSTAHRDAARSGRAANLNVSGGSAESGGSASAPTASGSPASPELAKAA